MAKKYFSVDARTVLALGRESIKDHTTAVLELVKNAYDAGATIVDIEINVSDPPVPTDFIRLADNGQGMTEDDLTSKWLRIGYSEKRIETHKGDRRRVGEKGVGRLSADRLGRFLSLKSQAKNAPSVALEVNWDDFDDPGRDLSKIPLTMSSGVSLEIPEKLHAPDSAGLTVARTANSKSKPGTELLINGLRQSWTKSDFRMLAKELSILTPPFGNVTDFEIGLSVTQAPELSGVIASPFYEVAEVQADFRLLRSGKIDSRIADRHSGKAKHRETAEWTQFVHRALPPPAGDQAPGEHDTPKDAADVIGPVKVSLLFYPRATSTVKGTELTLGQLREFLNSHAGVRVYRDSIRVMPYGDLDKPEGGDWLGLGDRKTRNPAGAGRSDFRLSPNQLVGAVFITRDDNPTLMDTSGREGLVHGEAFSLLKSFLLGCIFRLESYYHELFLNRETQDEGTAPSPRDTVSAFGKDLQDLRKQIDDIKSGLPKSTERKIEAVQDRLEDAVQQIPEIQRTLEELASQTTIYRGLASLGIASATFSHETDLSLDQFLSALYAARNMLKAGSFDVTKVLRELDKSDEAGRRISAWGKFALRRIRPDKRRRKKIRIVELVQSLISELQAPFAASGITLTSDLKEVEGRFFPMDVESVVLNLLTNAYFFSKQGSRARKVSISTNERKDGERAGVEIVISDSGPGVSPDLRSQVWKPLFSTKVDEAGRATGTGLGLSIVDDVVRDLNGTKAVDTDPSLKGARFTIWLPSK